MTQNAVMPIPGKRWRHVIVNTHSSWLPGDPRSFRNRDHRIHSSGDYKHPPPPGEHAGLHDYNLRRASPPVILPQGLRQRIGEAFLACLNKEHHRVVALSVSATHIHILVELPDDLPEMRRILGRCKRSACEVVKHEMPGSIWSAGGEFKPIRDSEHQQNTFVYILCEQDEDAWTWDFRKDTQR